MPDVKQVFISHIHEEAALGNVVKAIIEDAFSRDGVRAFLSSDMRDIPAGRRWLTEITEQLDQARVIVSLISPTSLGRPWVNIELGAGWIKGLRVIPLCHSGLIVNTLPRPFGDFNGVGLDQNDAAQRLLGGIADGLGLVHPKRLDFAGMLVEMRAAATKVKASHAAPSGRKGDREHDDLEPEQVRILQTLASAANQGQENMLLANLPTFADIKPAAFSHYINHLYKWQFVYIDRFTSGEDEVRLLPAGAKWLMDHNAMPD
jgi:hypothetical protein